jgi:hydroxyacylglutathione hydrolase
VIFKQFYLDCLAHASYFIADIKSGTAAVVDPQRDIELYLELATRHGVKIRHVLLTHFHADFIAGHLELRERTGAMIYLGARAKAEYAFTPLKDGDIIEFSDVRLQALETPGHTVESISILIYDLAKDAENPHAVLTGDTLFVGEVGRPDLRVALGWSATELGGMLYDSLHTKLLPLPDGSLVYPAHGAGSLCGRNIGAETVSTIGEQRRTNYALQPMTREQFIDVVTADQPDAPPYFTYDAVLNTKEHQTLERVLEREAEPLALADALRLRDAGAQVLDAREPEAFARAHLQGSVNIGLSGRYASWAGTVLDSGKPVVLVTEAGREQEATMRLGRIGLDKVAGFLEGGVGALDARPEVIGRTERAPAASVAAALASTKQPLILDVRDASEYHEMRIAGSLNVPLSRLSAQTDQLPRDADIIVCCESGYRSSIGASLLKRQGFAHVKDLANGIEGWRAAGLPLERSGSTPSTSDDPRATAPSRAQPK